MDFDPEHPLLVACRALGAAFDDHDAAVAAGLNVSRNELRLLNALEHGPRPQVELAAQLGLTRGAISPMIDRLAARELVQRDTPATDRRVNLVSLTPHSWRVLARHYGPTGQRVMASVETMPGVVVDQLAAQLHGLAAALQVASHSAEAADSFRDEHDVEGS